MLCLDETMKNAPRHRRVNMSGGDAVGFYLTRFFRKMMALVTFSLPACQPDNAISASPALPGRFHLFQNAISHTTDFNKALYSVEGEWRR